jgi:hypothetical protein
LYFRDINTNFYGILSLSCHTIVAHWDPNSGSGGVPQLKGARCFSFEELKKYTNKFSEANSIGSGGYGKV